MTMPVQPMRRVRFGPFELDLKAGELRTHDRRVILQHQPFQILMLLVESGGEVVTREEIRQALWSRETFVEFEQSIGTAMKKLRQALGDDADLEEFEVPLAFWRVHATAAEFYEHTGNRECAEDHRKRSRATILKLANSLPADELLRKTFLAAPAVCRVLGTAERVRQSTAR